MEMPKQAIYSTNLSTISTPEPQGVGKLSGQRLALFNSFDERDAALSKMYLGGIKVLEDSTNPDRFAQCAHSMRELMEKLPELLDVPTQAQKESLKTKVRELEDAYWSTQKKTNCFSSNVWDGSIDGHLRKFLSRIGNFFEWFKSHHPRRRDELHAVLTRLDGGRHTLPKPLASLNVDAWDQKRDYFQSVAHHRRRVEDEDEFRQRLDALERFLLDRLKPRTFEDFTEIDALLDEGNENA